MLDFPIFFLHEHCELKFSPTSQFIIVLEEQNIIDKRTYDQWC